VLLVILALACVATVPLLRGDLRRLGELNLRAGWAAFAAIALQVGVTELFARAGHTLPAALHIASYGLAGVFLVANRHIPGLWIMGLGGGMNALAIALNGGVMPASRTALEAAGIAIGTDFANSAPVAHPRLLALGDIIAVPGPWPIANVLSAGDLVLFAGLLVLLHRACRSRGLRPARRPARAPGSAAR
jgi:hypothetical protein